MNSLSYSPTTIEYALLGFSREAPTHGYEIYRRLTNSGELSHVWSIKQSHLYALLAQLEKEGCLVSKLEQQDAKPPRKVFYLTPLGESTFLDWVKTPVEHARQIRLEFLAKLYFAQKEGGEIVSFLLRQQQLVCQRWLDRQQRIADDLEYTPGYAWLICQFRMGQVRAMINWLELCQRSFEGAES